jgi:uncharacterized membrane protein YidH (DUF202 family)
VALAALGFVVARFDLVLREVHEPSTTARVMGVVLVFAAALALLLGILQYRQVARLLAKHGDPLAVPRWPAMTAALVTLLGIVAVAVYLATGVH